MLWRFAPGHCVWPPPAQHYHAGRKIHANHLLLIASGGAIRAMKCLLYNFSCCALSCAGEINIQRKVNIATTHRLIYGAVWMSENHQPTVKNNLYRAPSGNWRAVIKQHACQNRVLAMIYEWSIEGPRYCVSAGHACVKRAPATRIVPDLLFQDEQKAGLII